MDQKKYLISISDLIEYYVIQNHSRKDTADYFGLTDEALKNYLRRHRIKKDDHRCTLSYETLYELYITQNRTLSEIATITGYSKDQVFDRKNKLGIVKEHDLLIASEKRIFGSADFKERVRNTLLQKYGVEHPAQSKELMEKRKQNNIQKYGVGNVMQDQNISTKRKMTMLKRYGVEFPCQRADMLQKQQESVKNKYGAPCVFQTEYFAKNAWRRYIYNEETFDSSWELALYVYAMDHGEEIQRTPMILSFLVDGVEHYYIPDFLYKGKLIEIKGDHLCDGEKLIDPYKSDGRDKIYEAKSECMRTNNVSLWTHDDIKFALDYINSTYGKNYLKQFKNK